MFCVASSTTRAAWCRGLDAWAWALGTHWAAWLHPCCHCRPNLPGMGFFSFSFSQLDQSPEGMIWRSSSNPSCLAVRMYPCRQQGDKIIKRESKFRESSYAYSRSWAGLPPPGGGWAGVGPWCETLGSYHPVEVVTLLAQGWAPTPRPGAPQHEGSGDACPGEGHVRSPWSRGGVGRAGPRARFWERRVGGLWGA